jgi:hypothetical protein
MATFELRELSSQLNQLSSNVGESHNVINKTRSPITVVGAEYVPAGAKDQALLLTPIAGSEVIVPVGATMAFDPTAIATVGVFQLSPQELTDNTIGWVEAFEVTPLARKSKAKAKTEGA